MLCWTEITVTMVVVEGRQAGIHRFSDIDDPAEPEVGDFWLGRSGDS